MPLVRSSPDTLATLEDALSLFAKTLHAASVALESAAADCETEMAELPELREQLAALTATAAGPLEQAAVIQERLGRLAAHLDRYLGSTGEDRTREATTQDFVHRTMWLRPKARNRSPSAVGAAQLSQSPLPVWGQSDPVRFVRASPAERSQMTAAWAAGWDSVTGLSSPDRWVSRVNPGWQTTDGRRANCWDCTRAVALSIEGRPMVARAMPLGGTGIAEMEAWTGVKQVSTTPEQVQKQLLGLAVGSYAVVGIDRANNSAGHWFVAYRAAEGVKYLDGQTGAYSDWPPTSMNATYWDVAVRERRDDTWSWI